MHGWGEGMGVRIVDIVGFVYFGLALLAWFSDGRAYLYSRRRRSIELRRKNDF